MESGHASIINSDFNIFIITSILLRNYFAVMKVNNVNKHIDKIQGAKWMC